MSEFSLLAVVDAGVMEPLIEPLISMFEQDLQCLHIRTGTTNEKDLENLLRKIPPAYLKRIVLHGHYSLAIRLGLKGIHLTEKAKKDAETLVMLKQAGGLNVSASFHSLLELDQNKQSYTYVFLSPVFDSISKTGTRAAFEYPMLKTFLSAFKQKENAPKVIALGGIDWNSVLKVSDLGFDGAAVYGALWNAADPVSVFRRIRDLKY